MFCSETCHPAFRILKMQASHHHFISQLGLSLDGQVAGFPSDVAGTLSHSSWDTGVHIKVANVSKSIF